MNESPSRQPLGAIFSSREAAHATVAKLHEADIHDTWIGVTHAHDAALDEEVLEDARGGNRAYVPDAAVGSTLTGAMMTDAAVHDLTTSGKAVQEIRVEDDDDSLLDKIGRFFSGTTELSLYDALVDHGLSEIDARRLETEIVPEDVILLIHLSEGGVLFADTAAVDAKVLAIVESAGGRLLTGLTASPLARARPHDFATIAEDMFVERTPLAPPMR